MCQCVYACLFDRVCVVFHTGVERHIQEVNKSVTGENGNMSLPFLATCTRSYLNFRALCSVHLQRPTHCLRELLVLRGGGEGGSEWRVGEEKGRGMRGHGGEGE